jgi:hypothetical protein
MLVFALVTWIATSVIFVLPRPAITGRQRWRHAERHRRHSLRATPRARTWERGRPEGRSGDMQNEPVARRGRYIPVASGAVAGSAFGLIVGGLIGGMLGWTFLPQVGAGIGAVLGIIVGYRISRVAAGDKNGPATGS